MDDPRVPDHDLTSLRAVTHIGAAAAPVLRRRARERLGPVIAHTYGASEMGIVAALGPASTTGRRGSAVRAGSCPASTCGSAAPTAASTRARG